MSQKKRIGGEKSKEKCEEFDHCDLRQVTDASAASPPLLDQLVANMVP